MITKTMTQRAITTPTIHAVKLNDDSFVLVVMISSVKSKKTKQLKENYCIQDTSTISKHSRGVYPPLSKRTPLTVNSSFKLTEDFKLPSFLD